MAHTTLSEQLAGDDRRRNLWPLPGGAAAYPDSLQAILRAAAGEPSGVELQDRVAQLFPQVTSTSTARGYTGVLFTLGFARRGRGGAIVLTPEGKRFARNGDLKLLRVALVERVYGAIEVLRALDGCTLAYPGLSEVLRAEGVSWDNAMALRYRVWWLRAAGALEADRRMRADWLRLTAAGRALLRNR